MSVANRYARAAVQAAQEKGGAEAVEALIRDIIEFRSVYESNDELRQLLTNPALVNDRGPVLDTILSKSGMSDSAVALVKTLAERDRMGELYEIVESAERMADELSKRLHAEVWSPMTLDDTQKKSLQGALEKRLGQSVLVDVNVAPELLGGLVVQVGDLKFDSSIKRQLEILRERLESAAT
ncbi:MAG: ATP synthase F1 subunit delta [Myxococcota bacterium]